MLEIPLLTDLYAQPADFIEKKRLWREQKNRAEEARQKEQERKARRR